MKNQKNKSTLSEVWQKMKEIHFPSLELSTCHGYEKKWSLLKDLNHYHMDEITALVINDWIVSRKKWYLSNDYEKLNRGGSSKCNMQNELNFLKQFLIGIKTKRDLNQNRKMYSCQLDQDIKRCLLFAMSLKHQMKRKFQ